MKKKEKKIILEHLLSVRKSDKKMPEDYKFLHGVTQIHYGYMGYKTITPEMIEKVREEYDL